MFFVGENLVASICYTHMWPEVVNDSWTHDSTIVAHAVGHSIANDNCFVSHVFEREAAVDEAVDRAHESLLEMICKAGLFVCLVYLLPAIYLWSVFFILLLNQSIRYIFVCFGSSGF